MSLELLAKEQDACAFRSARWFASLTLFVLIALQATTVGATVLRPSYGADTIRVASATNAVTERPVLVAQAAAPAATDAPAAPAAQDNGGIPGWVWLLLALIVIGIILWLRSRRNAAGSATTRGRGDEPIIKTRK